MRLFPAFCGRGGFWQSTACCSTVSYTHLDVYKRQVVLVCENCDISGTVNIGVALAVTHDGIAVNQENGLDNIQTVVIALQCLSLIHI